LQKIWSVWSSCGRNCAIACKDPRCATAGASPAQWKIASGCFGKNTAMPNSTPINRTAEPLLIGGANGDPVLPILIYQMGKVGSTPIMASLAAANLPYAHVHFLSSPHLKEVERYYSTLPQAKIPDHIQRSKQIRSLIDASSGKLKWKVITLVREPISRAVSDVFQNMADTIPGINSVGENSANQIISDYIVDRLDRFDEKTDYLCTWFDKEVKAAFELDVFATPFNQSAGFQIYRSAKADILCLKLENLSACHQQAFGDFLGVRNFKLIDANAASVKPYRGLYRRVQATIRIPPACLQRIYSSRFVQHFYTPEEIDRFKAKWQRRWGGPLRAAVNTADIQPPPAADDASDNGAEKKTHTVCGVSSRMVPGRIRRLNSCLQEQLPVIAVVTPSFNQARYLEACIDSVLSQNYPRLEYVIMDGGSTDNSVVIIKKYEKYLAYWQSRSDGGQYAAIKRVFEKREVKS